MLLEAQQKYTGAKCDIDYVNSILLSGAVVGIIAPLLEEQGGHPMHEILARITNVISSEDDEKCHKGVFRQTYNSFKHAGNNRKNIKPSEDLELETNVKLEAGRMLEVAISDFKEITVSNEVRNSISQEFINLL